MCHRMYTNCMNRILLDIICIVLALITSGWQKSMETSEYGMVVQESRNDGQEILLHSEMYQPFNKDIQ